MVLHGVAGIMVTEGIGGDMGLKVRQLRDEVRRYMQYHPVMQIEICNVKPG